MENQQSTNFNSQSTEIVSQEAPKILRSLFRIVGLLILILTGAGGVFYIAITAVSSPDMLTSATFIGLYGIFISSFILGYGYYEFKKWVIPLMGFSIISAIVITILKGFEIDLISLISFLINFLLLILGIIYRRYFIGSYKAWIIYVIFALAYVAMYTSVFQPSFLGGTSEAEIDAYINSQEFDIVFKDIIEEQLGEATNLFSKEQLNKFKKEVRENPDFRQRVRIILENIE